MRNTLLLAILAASPCVAAAEEMSYTYVEGGWTQVKLDDDFLDDPKGDGGYLRGSFAIAPQVYLFAGYSTVSKTYRAEGARLKYELNQPEFGIGYHHAFTDRVDFTADLAYVRLNEEVELSDVDPDLDGKYKDHTSAGRATVGVRGTPSARTELWLKGGYIDASDVEGSFLGNLGGQIKFARNWGVVGEVEVIRDVTRYSVGIRASF